MTPTTDLNRDGQGTITDPPVTTPPDAMTTPGTTGTEQTPEEMAAHIKKLNDENAQRRREANELREKLEAAERAKSAALEADLEKREEWKALAEQRQQQLDALTPLKAQVETMSATISKLLVAQVEKLSPEMRQMVETLPGDDVAKLDWLSANDKLLQKQPLPATGAGERSDPAGKSKQYTEEQVKFAQLLGTKLK